MSQKGPLENAVSLGVTVQTEEKQVAVTAAYRLNRAWNTSEEVVWAVRKELLYQNPLLCGECFGVGSWTEIDLSTGSSGWLVGKTQHRFRLTLHFNEDSENEISTQKCSFGV